jgi:hypothetical protein
VPAVPIPYWESSIYSTNVGTADASENCEFGISTCPDLQFYDTCTSPIISAEGSSTFGDDKQGKPFLTREPKVLLDEANPGKREGIHLMIGRHSYAAFGNPLATGRCGSMQRQDTPSGSQCSTFMTMPIASIPTVRSTGSLKSWLLISMKRNWKSTFGW